MADKLLTEMVSMDQQPGQGFIKEKLNELGQRRLDLEHGLTEVQQEMDLMERELVDTGMVRAALGQVKELFGALKPYEQRELMQLVLQRAEVNEREITLEVYALTEDKLPEKVSAEGDVVRMRPVWLPIHDKRQNFFRQFYVNFSNPSASGEDHRPKENPSQSDCACQRVAQFYG